MNQPIWYEGERLALPPLHSEVETDVCVVGLGGSGLAAVHELLDAGVRVVGVDAGIVAGRAAGRNGGFLLAGVADFHHDAVRRHGRSLAVELYYRTLEQIDRMITESPDAVRRTGSLRIASDDEEAADCEAQLESMRADELPVESYTGLEGRGLLIPTDGVYHPVRRCNQLARAAAARGARLFEQSAVTALDRGWVETAHGAVRCATVVVTVDGALAQLLPELAARVRTARLQMLATAPATELRLTRPVYTRWGYDYWQQLDDRCVVLGGSRDRHEADEWTTDESPTPPVQATLERFLREGLGVRATVTHRWAATVSYTADGLPICGIVRPGVFAAGAYSGTGNVVGALCGRAAARLAVGMAPSQWPVATVDLPAPNVTERGDDAMDPSPPPGSS